MMNVSVTDSNITVIFPDKGKVFSCFRESVKAKHLLSLIKDKDEEAVLRFFQPVGGPIQGLSFDDRGNPVYNGEPISNGIERRIREAVAIGLSTDMFCKFLDKVRLNPSFNSRNQLFGFLDANDLPLTEDGNFIAYKAVRNDFFDAHSGTVKYDIGSVVSMPREKVDDNPENTCSHGLHVCSKEYGRFADRLLLVEVDPADVVAVPTEYHKSKMRVCKMRVLSEIEDFQDFKDTPIYMDAEYYDDQEWDNDWYSVQ